MADGFLSLYTLLSSNLNFCHIQRPLGNVMGISEQFSELFLIKRQVEGSLEWFNWFLDIWYFICQIGKLIKRRVSFALLSMRSRDFETWIKTKSRDRKCLPPASLHHFNEFFVLIYSIEAALTPTCSVCIGWTVSNRFMSDGGISISNWAA